jgi:hypothetical protein
VRADILLTYGKCLHDSIMSRGEVWAHRTSLTLPLFIEVLAPSQERSCLCVVGVDFNSQVFSNGF